MLPLQLIKYLPLVCFLGIVFSVYIHYNRDTHLDEGYYLVLFETDSKIAPHLRTFNRIKGTRYNHIGLLIRKFPTNQLLHVHPDYRGKYNSISQLELRDFLKNNTRICELWRVHLSPSEKQKLHASLDSLRCRKSIHYDYAYDLGNRNFYCSEFVYVLLRCVSVKKFRGIISKSKLHYPMNAVYQKDSIAYISVDFFKTNPYFSLVKLD